VAETRKLEAILCSDVVGYSRLQCRFLRHIGRSCCAEHPCHQFGRARGHELPAIHRNGNFVQMPKICPKSNPPMPDNFAGGGNSTFEQHLLDEAHTVRKAENTANRHTR
jgi:hypothetical protein